MDCFIQQWKCLGWGSTPFCKFSLRRHIRNKGSKAVTGTVAFQTLHFCWFQILICTFRVQHGPSDSNMYLLGTNMDIQNNRFPPCVWHAFNMFHMSFYITHVKPMWFFCKGIKPSQFWILSYCNMYEQKWQSFWCSLCCYSQMPVNTPTCSLVSISVSPSNFYSRMS